MRRIFVLLLFFATSAAFPQEHKQIVSVNFCSIRYKVPTDAKAESEYQIHGNDYSMSWLYFNEQMMEANIPEQFISQLADQLKQFKKEPVDVYLLGKLVKGYKVSFKRGNGTAYQLIAYGTANNQPVMVQLVLNKDPKATADIPDFPRQIVTLSN